MPSVDAAERNDHTRAQLLMGTDTRGVGDVEIVRLEARTVVVPLKRPTRIARRELEERHYTVVRVSAADGPYGYGFCLSGAMASQVIRLGIAPSVIGRSLYATEGLWEEVYYDTILNGRRGAVLRALSAVDIAMWDLKGKLLGLPCAKLLGVFRPAVPAYASGGYYYGGDPIREIKQEVSGWMEDGYKAIKIKVGGVPLEADVARVAAAREVAGYDVELMLDANNAWHDAATAARAIKRFEEYSIAWVEEPLSPDDVRGHAELRRRCTIPVATGEIEATRWGFLHLMTSAAADVLQPDATVVGGFTEWQRIAHTASSFGVPIAPHWFSDVHVHTVAAAPNGLWIEHFTDTSILNVMELYEASMVVKDGWAAVPSESGLGINMDERAIDRYAIDAWQ